MTTALTVREVLYCSRTHQVFCCTFFGINLVAGDAYNIKGRCARFTIRYSEYAKLVGQNMNNNFAKAISEINEVAKFQDRPIITT